MPARKISKSRKQSKRSSKRRSRKLQRGGMPKYQYSSDFVNWFPARDYQIEAINTFIERNNSNPNYNFLIYNQYDPQGIHRYFSIKPGIPEDFRGTTTTTDPNELTFIMRTKDNRVAYLKYNSY